VPQYVRAGTALLSGGEGDDDGKGTRVIDKVNVSFAEAVSGGNCDVERKLAGSCIESRCSTGEPQLAHPRMRLQITFLSTEISDRMWHTLRLKSHDQ